MAESPEREGESRGRGSPPPRRRSPERSPRREYSPRERSPPPPPRDRSPGPHRCENPGTNVYVSGLAQRTRDVDVERAFSKYGKCACRLVSDPRTQEHRGFAFVNYDYPEDAQDAIQGLNRTELDGRVISVELVRVRSSTLPQHPERLATVLRGGARTTQLHA